MPTKKKQEPKKTGESKIEDTIKKKLGDDAGKLLKGFFN